MCTINDIAEEFGVSKNTVKIYLSGTSQANFEKAINIREYAKRMGYEPSNHKKRRFNDKNCICCGKTFTPANGKQKHCPECGTNARAEYMKVKDKRRREKKRAESYWFNGNFHTKAEETKRMEELRKQGFSNAEIAKKIGRGRQTVYDRIGKQPKEMTMQNIAIGKKIQAQKNAARKQYVINQPIIEYNKKVEEMNKVKAELDALQKDISVKQKIAETNARKTVKAPSIVLTTTQIAG